MDASGDSKENTNTMTSNVHAHFAIVDSMSFHSEDVDLPDLLAVLLALCFDLEAGWEVADNASNSDGGGGGRGGAANCSGRGDPRHN